MDDMKTQNLNEMENLGNSNTDKKDSENLKCYDGMVLCSGSSYIQINTVSNEL
jgi:hypothetical protein